MVICYYANLRFAVGLLGTSILFLQHGGVQAYLVTIDSEFSNVTAPYLYREKATLAAAEKSHVVSLFRSVENGMVYVHFILNLIFDFLV